MYKRKGFALLQTLVVLMIVILLVSMSLNLITFNYLKSQTFNSYNDKRSLSIEEENVLKDFNKNLNTNSEITTKIPRYEFLKKDNRYYIIKKVYVNSKVYIEIEMKEYKGNKFFVPTFYKTKNIEE